MGFAETLATQPPKKRDGWTHNPSGAPGSPDAVATRIANRYITEITNRLLDMGYMPLTGVEANFLTAPCSPDTVVKYINEATREYRAALVRQAVGPLSRALQAEAVASLESVARDLAASQSLLPADQAKERSHWLQWVNNELLPLLREKGVEGFSISSGALMPAHNLELLEYTKSYPDDKEVRKLSACIDTILDMHTKLDTAQKNAGARFKDGAIAIDPDSCGSVYVDNRMDVELATEIGSPRATVARVNAIKKTAWEVGNEYERQWRAHIKEHGESSEEAPRSRVAQLMRDKLKPSFDVFFRAVNANCGEHLNISLWKTDHKDYTRLNETMKKSKNLMDSEFWRELVADTLCMTLPADTLLGLGNDAVFERKAERHKCETTKDGRVEVRSFNNATSNVSLTMLATLASVYTLVKTMREMPRVEGRGLHGELRYEDKMEILQKMKDDYDLRDTLPRSKEAALDAFQHSVTLDVMRELAETYKPRPGHEGESPLSIEDVDAFHEAAQSRVEHLERCRG